MFIVFPFLEIDWVSQKFSWLRRDVEIILEMLTFAFNVLMFIGIVIGFLFAVVKGLWIIPILVVSLYVLWGLYLLIRMIREDYLLANPRTTKK